MTKLFGASIALALALTAGSAEAQVKIGVI